MTGSLNSSGNVNVNASSTTATLAGTGSVGNVSLSGNSNTVLPGVAVNSTGTLAMSSLNASGGANLQFDLGGGAGNTGHDLINVSGAATLNNATVTVSLIPGDTIAQGTYTLLHAGSLTNNAPTDNIPVEHAPILSPSWITTAAATSRSSSLPAPPPICSGLKRR